MSRVGHTSGVESGKQKYITAALRKSDAANGNDNKNKNKNKNSNKDIKQQQVQEQERVLFL